MATTWRLRSRTGAPAFPRPSTGTYSRSSIAGAPRSSTPFPARGWVWRSFRISCVPTVVGSSCPASPATAQPLPFYCRRLRRSLTHEWRAMSETLLIVEDDASILRGLHMNLQMEGYRLLTARDGEEALRAWR